MFSNLDFGQKSGFPKARDLSPAAPGGFIFPEMTPQQKKSGKLRKHQKSPLFDKMASFCMPFCWDQCLFVGPTRQHKPKVVGFFLCGTGRVFELIIVSKRGLMSNTHILRRNRTWISNFLSHRIVESLRFMLFGKSIHGKSIHVIHGSISHGFSMEAGGRQKMWGGVGAAGAAPQSFSCLEIVASCPH